MSRAPPIKVCVTNAVMQAVYVRMQPAITPGKVRIGGLGPKAQKLQAARDKAWAKIDDEITAGGYVDMWIWDNDVNIRSKNVLGVQSKFNASWDVTYTSVK